MSKAEKIGLFFLLLWCLIWGIGFGYLVFVMPNYGTGVFAR